MNKLLKIIGQGLRLSVLVVFLGMLVVRPVAAFTNEALDGLHNDSYFYDPTVSFCSTTPAGSSGSDTASPSEAQINNAKTIIGVAKTENLGQQGALIGLMVGLAESGLQNEANPNVPVSLSIPHEGTSNDHDSVGVFQQRPSTGWSTIATGQAAISNRDAVAQLMTPAYAAEAFFGSPPGSKAPPALSKGLQNISGWQSMDPAQAAQKVQASAFSNGSNYRKQQAAAQSLIDQLYGSAPAIPLPVPITGGVPGSGQSGPASGSCSGGSNTGSIAGCVNPFADAGWGLARTDQGVDFQPATPLPVKAICDGTILSTDGSGWPGGYFILIKLSSGPFAGKCTFVAEKLNNVSPAGTKVKAGQQIATALPGYPWTEWGWAAGPQTPSTRYNGAPDGTPMPGGKAFARFLRHLGAQTRDDPGPGSEYEGNSCS